ncbi:uncharacterized protein DEA37_0007212 [Paragonimus westermani]|uniref:Uncharacterized protein n=1 Tax=Paragonimus westermani TaxID=34504 RepID=A0A5J4NMX8_9TREM|nr:uncharacterized protein DEA37_0007212 [Paragonimus westermani]
MERKLQPITSSSEYRNRRLKSLQFMEERRLDIINKQLSKAQLRASRQLEFQRSQFQRSLSETNCLRSTTRDSSLTHASGVVREDDWRQRSRSIAKLHRDSQTRSKFTQGTSDTADDSTQVPYAHSWLRLRSLGTDWNEDNTAEFSVDSPPKDASPEPTQTELMEVDHESDNERITESGLHARGFSHKQDTSSPGSKSDGDGSKNIFDFKSYKAFSSDSSPVARQADKPRIVRDTKPLWLAALHKLRKERLNRQLTCSQCEEMAALVCGCSGKLALNHIYNHSTDQLISYLIFQFEYSCSDNHLDKTDYRLHQEVSEHVSLKATCGSLSVDEKITNSFTSAGNSRQHITWLTPPKCYVGATRTC